MWKTIGKFCLMLICVFSITVTAGTIANYYKSGPHPNRAEQYTEFLKDKDVFMGPDSSLHVLTPEQVQKCNAGGGCIRITYAELEALMRGAYMSGEETKISGHD